MLPSLHATGSIPTKYFPYTMTTLPPSVGPLAGVTYCTRMSAITDTVISDSLWIAPAPAEASTVMTPRPSAGLSHRSSPLEMNTAGASTSPYAHAAASATKSAPVILAIAPPRAYPVFGDTASTRG